LLSIENLEDAEPFEYFMMFFSKKSEK